MPGGVTGKAREGLPMSIQLYLSILQEVIAFFKMPNFFGSGYAGLGMAEIIAQFYAQPFLANKTIAISD